MLEVAEACNVLPRHEPNDGRDRKTGWEAMATLKSNPGVAIAPKHDHDDRVGKGSVQANPPIIARTARLVSEIRKEWQRGRNE
jgi:hypothetical protein